MVEVKVKSLSCVRLFVISWTLAYQAPLSMGFSRQEYWSGLPFPNKMVAIGKKWIFSSILVVESTDQADESEDHRIRIWCQLRDDLHQPGFYVWPLWRHISLRISGHTLSSRLPWWLRWQSICLQCRRPRFDPWVGKIPWGRKWQPTSVFLPGESHGQRSLVGYSLWGHKESDMTEWLHFLLLLCLLPVFQSNTDIGTDAKNFAAILKNPNWFTLK